MKPTESVRQNLIGLTEYSSALLGELVTELGLRNRSEAVEWLILCQRHSARDAAAIFARRKYRGARGPVVVLPDDAQLPPEG